MLIKNFNAMSSQRQGCDADAVALFSFKTAIMDVITATERTNFGHDGDSYVVLAA